MADGTSNTLMVGEYLRLDDDYVLTAVQHTATDASRFGEPVTFTFTVSVEPAFGSHDDAMLL